MRYDRSWPNADVGRMSRHYYVETCRRIRVVPVAREPAGSGAEDIRAAEWRFRFSARAKWMRWRTFNHGATAVHIGAGIEFAV
jgi:hypothetical protein